MTDLPSEPRPDLPPADLPLAERVAGSVRNGLISGDFLPGEKLSETQIAARFDISRNTLREVFRLLTGEGLLVHLPNRGVYVAAPDEAAILDIYRVRQIVQLGALHAAVAGHPALARMREQVVEGVKAQQSSDWRRVGTANMAFHRAMIGFSDSPRLAAYFDRVLAELRLVFGQLEDAAYLHEPYIPLNADLIARIEAGDLAGAERALQNYLVKSERSVLAAFARAKGQRSG